MMKELAEYRQKLINRLEQAAAEFRAACLAARQPHEPTEAGGWSVHQIAVHTRDVQELVYDARTCRTLAEDNPAFPNFDSETYLAEHYDPKEPLATLLDGFASGVTSLVKALREMQTEGWSRTSSHETQGGGITLQTWVERGLDHIEEHLKTVKRAV
jgi:hypothetical protein